MSIGEGFAGSCAKTRKIKLVKDIPEDSLYSIRSFVGRIKPKNMMFVPILQNSELLGVLGLASLHEYGDEQLEMVNLITPYISETIASDVSFERIKRLTNELQFQNHLIADLNNDLEKKMAEDALFTTTLFNAFEEYAVFAVDKNETILTWNQGATAIFGYLPKEAVGKPISSILAEPNKNNETIEEYISFAKNQGHYATHGKRKKKDGTVFLADIKIFVRFNRMNEFVSYTVILKNAKTNHTTNNNGVDF